MATEAYRVEIDKKGCAHCGAETYWTVVGPGEVDIGSSWADEETANDIRDLMNMAYDAGTEANAAEVELYRGQYHDARLEVAALQESAKARSETKYSEKPVAWLIVRHSGAGGASAKHLEVVLSPLTDDTYMDEGDEAWPLYSKLNASGERPEIGTSQK